MRAGLVIMGAAVIGGLGMQWVLVQEQREALSQLREELARSTLVIGKLEEAVSRSTRASARPWAGPELALVAPPIAGVPPTSGGDEEAREAAVAEPPAAPDVDAPASRSQVEASFQAESVDSGWASSAQREVRDTLASMLPASALVRGLDCRATLCRLEVDFSAEAEFREVMGSPGALIRLWSGPAVTHFEKDPARGTVTLVSYLVRPGHEMPVPQK